VKKLLTIAALTASTFTAQAEVRINGFANFTGGMTDSNNTLYGYDDRFSFSEESLFAIQISGDINDKMTATGQLVAKGANNYDPEFEWAYLTYEATDNLSIVAGRLRLPLFNYSASKDVGYSYHWLTTPRSVYDVPFNNLEGIRFDYADYAGDWEYNINFSTGTFNGPTLGTEVTGNNALVLSAEATYDWFKIRGVAGTAKSTLNIGNSTRADLIQASAGLDSIYATGFSELGELLKWEDDKGEFLGLSVQVDKFDWFVSAEITSIDVAQSFLSSTEAYYVTAGMRKGKWTPSITYEKSKSEADIKFPSQVSQLTSAQLSITQVQNFVNSPFGMSVNQGVIAAVGAPLTLLPQPNSSAIITGALNSVSNGLLFANNSEDTTVSATLRYDYDVNIALKVDVSKFTDDLSDQDVTLIRFGANYVF
jgi:hypothetical protein